MSAMSWRGAATDQRRIRVHPQGRLRGRITRGKRMFFGTIRPDLLRAGGTLRQATLRLRNPESVREFRRVAQKNRARRSSSNERLPAESAAALYGLLTERWPSEKQRNRGEYLMRIAIPLTGGRLAMHFGHCERFALVDVDGVRREIVGRQDVEAPPHEPGVVTSGAFRYVRHPLYLGSMLLFFCLAAAMASLFSVALCAGIVVFYNHIADYEERLLCEKYGSEYWGYTAETGRWWPRIRVKSRYVRE